MNGKISCTACIDYSKCDVKSGVIDCQYFKLNIEKLTIEDLMEDFIDKVCSKNDKCTICHSGTSIEWECAECGRKIIECEDSIGKRDKFIIDMLKIGIKSNYASLVSRVNEAIKILEASE